MKERQKLDFLLGALSPSGFAGYFDQLLTVRPGWRVALVKAGPGCGKSTLMSRVADALLLQGENVELIHCSSDPDSLDGVICENRRFAIVDATAPHTLEPRYPGACEEIISLYDCIDRAKMRSSQAQVIELFLRCSALQERAGRYVTAAGSLITDSMKIAGAAANLPAAQTFAGHLVSKYLPRKGGEGSESMRLLSANTAHGVLCYTQTVEKLAQNIVVLKDDWGAVSKAMMKVLRDKAVERGYHVITCYCPLFPHDKIDHLLIPELSLAFVTSNSWHPFELPGSRAIHCRRFCARETLYAYRVRLRFNHKSAADLLSQASALQAEAGRCHEELEVFYKSAADFDRIDQITERLIDSL